jgi:DNA-binding LytR/AlgR family response regulator
MKIHLHIDSAHEEIEVHIYAAEYSEAIEKIMGQLKQPATETIIGYLQQDIHIVKLNDIYAVISEGAKVYLQTDEQEYETKLKLYEMEDQYSKMFARINKSTLININKLQSIQNKLGSAQGILLNDVRFPISRRYLKELKIKLGIGG